MVIRHSLMTGPGWSNFDSLIFEVQPFTRFELSPASFLILIHEQTLVILYYLSDSTKLLLSLFSLKFLLRFIIIEEEECKNSVVYSGWESLRECVDGIANQNAPCINISCTCYEGFSHVSQSKFPLKKVNFWKLCLKKNHLKHVQW